MSKYVNLKCGSCGYSFTGGYTPGYVSLLGVTREKCPSCMSYNRTQSIPYSLFSWTDKVGFWFGRTFRLMFRGAWIGTLLGYGLAELMDFSQPASDTCIVSVMLVGVLVNTILGYYYIRKEIDEIELMESLNNGEIEDPKALIGEDSWPV